MTLEQLKSLFVSVGCKKLYAKELAPNDNSKNQIYFGKSFDVLNLFPNQGIISGKRATTPIFKAALKFGWLQSNGSICEAPSAQFILYPQYPEVRFSGFIRGCSKAPSDLMTIRQSGRILFLGINTQQLIVGCVVDSTSPIAMEFHSTELPAIGVFRSIQLSTEIDEGMAKQRLLSELKRIHDLGWIESKQLDSKGEISPCNATQCGGFTLEAELGIPKNNNPEPDYLGWEIKQHSVKNFDRPVSGGPITLMTPEPNGGFYCEQGIEAFIRRYGYPDKKGQEDRINFGGIYKVGLLNRSTELEMRIRGYDLNEMSITDSNGAIELACDNEVVVASWAFSSIFAHWSRKHSKVVYVPSICQNDPIRKYHYGHKVRLAQITDPLYFLKAIAIGKIYYDPGIKLENASSSRPRIKRRSQFRVKSKDIGELYRSVEFVEL